MLYDSADPYNDDGGGFSGGTGGYVDSGITDPGPTRPTWKPKDDGFWQLIGGVWHWFTEEGPRSLKTT